MQIAIKGTNELVTDELRKYVERQFRTIEKQLLPSCRETAEAEVSFRRKGEEQACKLSLTLPKDRFMIEETTVNAYAAVDIVMPATRDFLRAYNRRHGGGKLYHRLRMRLARI